MQHPLLYVYLYVFLFLLLWGVRTPGVRRLEYKYIIKEGPLLTWEPGKNHLWAPPAAAAAATAAAANKELFNASTLFTLKDSWGEGEG